MPTSSPLIIDVAGTTLKVLHTPGHAPGAVCLYAADLGCVFTGDTLFVGKVGGTDLGAGGVTFGGGVFEGSCFSGSRNRWR